MKKKAFVGTRGYYYKFEAAAAILDHSNVLRNGFTHSQNVYKEYTPDNIGHYFHGAKSCSEALEMMCQKHKAMTGKKVRSDCNVLFEHVVWLSEHQYTLLELKYGKERIKNAFLARLKQYAESVKIEFGFEPLGIELHFDEGRYDTIENRFIRNVHAHVQFMNYSFEKRFAPLRHMMKNGCDEHGRTNALNPNFEKLQDLVAEPFKNMGFVRGVSKNITSREHLKKENFVKQKHQNLELRVNSLHNKETELLQSVSQKRDCINELDKNLNHKRQELSWLESSVKRLLELKSQLSNAIVSKCRQRLNTLLRDTLTVHKRKNTLKH